MIFRLYGFVIESANLLQRLTPISPRKIDAKIQRVSYAKSFPQPSHWFMNWTLPGGAKWLSCAKTEGGYLLRFNELADFTIDRSGREIVCMPRSGISEDTIQHLLLDQVIPLVINLRGGEALHASAILTSHGAVAFTGPAGSGKSTLAGSFLLSGYQHMSDDCLALLEKEREIHAIPAYPELRLWDDALSYLFGNNGAHESVSHYTDKRRVQLAKEIGSTLYRIPAT